LSIDCSGNAGTWSPIGFILEVESNSWCSVANCSACISNPERHWDMCPLSSLPGWGKAVCCGLVHISTWSTVSKYWFGPWPECTDWNSRQGNVNTFGATPTPGNWSKFEQVEWLSVTAVVGWMWSPEQFCLAPCGNRNIHSSISRLTA